MYRQFLRSMFFKQKSSWQPVPLGNLNWHQTMLQNFLNFSWIEHYQACHILSHNTMRKAASINRISINPRWWKAFRARKFKAFVSHIRTHFERISASIWFFVVCRIYWRHVLISRSVLWEKTGCIGFGILVGTDGLVDRNVLVLLIVTD